MIKLFGILGFLAFLFWHLLALFAAFSRFIHERHTERGLIAFAFLLSLMGLAVFKKRGAESFHPEWGDSSQPGVERGTSEHPRTLPRERPIPKEIAAPLPIWLAPAIRSATPRSDPDAPLARPGSCRRSAPPASR